MSPYSHTLPIVQGHSVWVEADFVTVEGGTGVVHIAPGFGGTTLPWGCGSSTVVRHQLGRDVCGGDEGGLRGVRQGKR